MLFLCMIVGQNENKAKTMNCVERLQIWNKKNYLEYADSAENPSNSPT